MIQLFYASTLFGAMTLAAALDAGKFGERTGRRVLLVSNNAAIPEIAAPLDETPGFAALRDRFDEIRSWNELVSPLHPSDWKARVIEVPMLGRLIASHLELGDGPAELVVESLAVPPARTIAGLVRECPITVYSDGLMSYGPTRNPLPLEISGRLTRLLHLDLVPGLSPLLLGEHDVPAEPLPGPAFTSVVDQVAGACAMDVEGDAVILGQYLSALDIVTAEEEAELHASMLRGLVARGHDQVVFKPHPAAGRRHAQQLRQTAEDLGVRLTVAGEAVPAEALFAALRPSIVVGCFSTALSTAARYFGLPVATVGAELVLERLAPYENSNRIPITIIDATVPRMNPDGTLTDAPFSGRDITSLIHAVGYCMQSTILPGLRETAAAYVAEAGPARYFKRQRLAALDLARDEAGGGPAGTLARLRRKLARALP
ncbi:alpha-2,8-polysialyltransferase family protein [Spongiactinospora sp. TRM90649]|uniref:alpha-2,8-polysialyltransferase family protein n=1 Tax=Spongiactinospora sp. TRM90649 TaxID=3031114 RepID=UPI0023F8C135|nr:alpha-2,8-polysialyltransferase family protein [Spongiactinospora sp. TRM90649]MDF5753879.1 alpha-2,8-polysialyltransferase family protein [Spongiactinospora sp. TRM90649]